MTIADQLREAAEKYDPFWSCPRSAFAATQQWLQFKERLSSASRDQIAWFFLLVAEALEDE